MTENTAAPSLHAPIHERRRIRRILAIVLLLLSMGGIAMLQFRSDYASTYWMVMVPIFAVVNAIGAWPHAGTDASQRATLIRRLVLHWVGLGLALALVFLVMDETALTGEMSGLLAALLLALTCFLAGVHFDWHFLLLGTVLGVTVAGGAIAEQYFWFATVVAIVAVIVVGVVRRQS